MEGVELIEQKLLEENSKELFSLFTTFHDIDVLQIFYIIQVDFVSTCLQMQNFDSEQGKDMDVHEFQFVLKTTFTQVPSIQFFFWKNICILFLSCLLSLIVSNLT